MGDKSISIQHKPKQWPKQLGKGELERESSSRRNSMSALVSIRWIRASYLLAILPPYTSGYERGRSYGLVQFPYLDGWIYGILIPTSFNLNLHHQLYWKRPPLLSAPT